MKQLNLLQPAIIKRQPRLYQVLVLLILSCSFSAYYVFQQAQQSLETKQLIAQTRADILSAEQQITLLTDTLQTRQTLAELRQQESMLTAEQASLAGLNSALRSVNSTSRSGFAKDLTRLAQSSMPGLWLESVSLSYQGNRKTVRLAGITRASEDLNTYILRLEQMQLDTQLNVLGITANNNGYNFYLASSGGREQ
ncbi:hypothetical protein [Salinibius halmophilus]|uniref:hypothetical protein n=1 Tax=Salinibius halmophilus TaxID=1853216 RepID=UPI000E66209C|nr:hypothetical protein [Salinibius halmophilus]